MQSSLYVAEIIKLKNLKEIYVKAPILILSTTALDICSMSGDILEVH